MQSRTIYYTIFPNEQGMYADGYKLRSIDETDAKDGQRATPAHGEAAIAKRMEEIWPTSKFQHVRLDPPAFWAKTGESRPACTVDENYDEYHPSWDNE